MPMATPMSAFFSAGASFTPSPVTATICPISLSALTTRSLCSGATRAKMTSCSQCFLQGLLVQGVQLGPGDDCGVAVRKMPMRRAMLSAVRP